MNYHVKILVIISELEEMAERTDDLNKNLGKESRGFATLLEIQKVGLLFQEITDEEAGEVEVFLEELLPKPEETLERYMSDKLGLVAKGSFNPDDYQSTEVKLAAVALAMFNSGNAKDFSLRPPKLIESSRIKEVITKYYADRGYSVEDGMCLFAKKEDTEILINMSNFGDRIMVSVVNL